MKISETIELLKNILNKVGDLNMIYSYNHSEYGEVISHIEKDDIKVRNGKLINGDKSVVVNPFQKIY